MDAVGRDDEEKEEKEEREVVERRRRALEWVGMKSGRSIRPGMLETQPPPPPPSSPAVSIRPSVESRRYLSFSVSIVNIEVAPDTVNFAAARQHC